MKHRRDSAKSTQKQIDLKVETHITFQKEVKPASFLVAVRPPTTIAECD